MRWIVVVDGWLVYGKVGSGRGSAATGGCTRSVPGGVIAKPYHRIKPVQPVISSATSPPNTPKNAKAKVEPGDSRCQPVDNNFAHALALGVIDVGQPRPQVPRELFRRAPEDVEDSTRDRVGGDGSGLVGFVHLYRS